MTPQPLLHLLALAVLLVLGCNRPNTKVTVSDATSEPSNGKVDLGPSKLDAGPQRDGSTPDRVSRSWSCGVGAGVCTCVLVGKPTKVLTQCADSACCFLSDDGSCSCRSSATLLSCQELKKALGAVSDTERCPQ